MKFSLFLRCAMTHILRFVAVAMVHATRTTTAMPHVSRNTVICFALCTSFEAISQINSPAAKATKYLFCIGINNYLANTNPATCKVCTDRELKNLNGCLNDVDTISRLMIKYYGFKAANMILLKDQQAARAAILDSLQRLKARCQRGDYVVFFYSGHGSYEYETAGDGQLQTGKRYRNTIIPADITQPGVRDINSADLNTIFSGFTDKGVVLTVITDCCHSATNTRGSLLFEADSTREVKPATDISKIAAPSVTAMTRQLDQFGALTIGSCQDNELAEETMLRPGTSYGAFTLSFCRAVTEWSQAPINVLLERTVARLRLLNKQQTPNMEASKRLTMNLVGTSRAQLRKSSFPLHITKGYLSIPAGFNDDIYNNDILVDSSTKDSIQVNSVGLSESGVLVINQSKKLRSADIGSLNFMVLKKLPNPDPPLKIFLGNAVSEEVYNQIIQKAGRLLQQQGIGYTWMNPSLEKNPDAVIFYKNGWKVNRNGITETATLEDLDAKQVNSLMDAPQIKTVYLQLPPTTTLLTQLTAKISGSKNRNIQIVDAASAADFTLSGHLINAGNAVVYGWEKTMQGNKTDDYKKAGLPALTDFFPVVQGGVYPTDSLTERVNRLSVLANWLSMKSPPPDKSLVFPYHLSIINLDAKTKADEKNMGVSSTTDKLDIRIETDAGSTLPRDKVQSLFIYVMSMDPKGNTFLLYPQPRTSILTYPNAILYDTSFYHLATVRHTTAGAYHYFFIALREPVSSRDVFTRHGVVKGDQPEPALSDNPLEALLNESGAGQRGDIRSFDHWLLKTVDIITDDKTVKKK